MFCSKCGYEIESDAKFCSSCGKEVSPSRKATSEDGKQLVQWPDSQKNSYLKSAPTAKEALLSNVKNSYKVDLGLYKRQKKGEDLSFLEDKAIAIIWFMFRKTDYVKGFVDGPSVFTERGHIYLSGNDVAFFERQKMANLRIYRKILKDKFDVVPEHYVVLNYYITKEGSPDLPDKYRDSHKHMALGTSDFEIKESLELLMPELEALSQFYDIEFTDEVVSEEHDVQFALGNGWFNFN